MAAMTDAPAAPGARAVARYVRTSAQKARRVVDLVRGLPAKEALTVLRFAPQRASVPVYKVVASAIANAENNEQLDPESLLITEAYVDEGPTLKRYRPRAQMRPGPIRKRTCHITVYVEAVQPAAPPRRRPRKQAAAEATVTESSAAPADAEAATTQAPAKKTGKAAKAPAKKAAAQKTAAAEQPAKKAAKKAPAKKAAKTAKAEEETE